MRDHSVPGIAATKFRLPSMTIWTICPGRSTSHLLFSRASRSRFYTSTSSALDAKAFSKTLLLPKTVFPLWTDPANSEEPYRRRTTEDLYRWQVRFSISSSSFGNHVQWTVGSGSRDGALHCLCYMTDHRMRMVIYIWVIFRFALCSRPLILLPLGHALNKVLKDIIIRSQLMVGKRVK